MIFYVKLNGNLLTALNNDSYTQEENDWPKETLKTTMKAFTMGFKYPVLSVKTMNVKSDTGESFWTMYHVPLENGVTVWAPSQIFRYAGTVPDSM